MAATTDLPQVPPDVRESSPSDLTSLTLGDLEGRLCCLAARIAAAECEFLELLAEFDARQGWGSSGAKSTAHWLSWRTGMRLGVARERLRVARSLRALPLVREAFAAGRLSYCKVRAVSRVATPPTEPELVELAIGATGAQLERIVRSWRTCLLAETSASSHVRRGWSRREEEGGSVVFTLRVAPEDDAVLDAAVVAARRLVLDGDDRPVETPEEAGLAGAITDSTPMQRAEADAVILIAESFLVAGSGASPGGSTQVVVHANVSSLDAALEAGRAAAERLAHDEAPSGTSVEQRSLATRPVGGFLDNGQPLHTSTVLRMMCTSPSQLMLHAADGRPLDLGRSRRHASRRQRRALRVRDGGCRFPGCTQRHRLIPHHVIWWSRLGPTDMDNLVLICPTHHRAVHELGYLVQGLGAGRFTFHRPDGSRLTESGEVAADPSLQLTPVPVSPTTIEPTWGGERLNLDQVIGGLAANALARAGHRLADIPYPDLDPALQRAVQWPQPPVPPPWRLDRAA